MKDLAAALSRAGIEPGSLHQLFEHTGEAIHAVEVDAARAVETWRRLRPSLAECGHVPVLLGDQLDRIIEQACERPSASRECLAEVAKTAAPRAQPQKFDHLRRLGPRGERMADLMAKLVAEAPSPKPEETTADETWPDETVPPLPSLEVLRSRTRISIALVPATQTWQVPIFMWFGGFNECPWPARHATLLRDWQARFGAELIALTTDTLELAVSRPPTTRVDALALAREQYAYCTDIVDQGTQTVGRLAASVLDAPYWFFWWD